MSGKELLGALSVLLGGALVFGVSWSLAQYYYVKLGCAGLPFQMMDYSQGLPPTPIRPDLLLCMEAYCSGLTPRRPPC
jgi:hypothetical protein